MADLTITSERMKAIDFTVPYMNTGKLIRLTNCSSHEISRKTSF